MARKNKEQELLIRIAGQTDRSLESSINRARRELNSLEREAGLSARGISDSFGGMSVKGIDSLAAMSDKVFGGMVKAAEMAGAGIAAGLGYSAVVGSSFEAQMSTVQSISNATGAEMGQLNSLAEKMGRTTKFSATEAGQGLEYMAMAGWKTQDMMNGLPGIMNLAAASGEDLAMTSDIVTDALTAFGKGADYSTTFADELAAASSNSNTNVAMMGETFKYVAPVAGSLGFSTKDTAIAAGLMANAGIKASQAGTAMRKIFTNLGTEVELTGESFGKMTVKAANTDGSMRELRNIITDLRGGFAQMSEAERSANAEALAGKTGMSGLLAIMNASEEDVQKLTEAIDNSAGAAERMSEIRMDNLLGDLTLLKSATEGAGIKIYEGMSGELRELVQGVTGWVNDFTGGLKDGMPTIRRQLKQFGRDVKEGFQPLLNIGEWFLKNPEVIEGSIAGIAGALITFKAVKAAKTGFKMLSSISTLITAWPVAAAGLAVGGIIGIGTAVHATNMRLKRENLAEHFGDMDLSMQELQKTASYIIKSESFDKLAQGFDELQKAADLQSKIGDAVSDINKMNWKVSIGMELTPEEMESYQNQIQNYINDSEKLVVQMQYTMSLNVGGMTGDDAMGQQIKDQFDTFYDEQYGELQQYGDQLGQVVSDAFSDGMLDIDETKAITELQRKMGNITQKLAASEFDAKLQIMEMDYSGAKLDADSFQNLQEELNTQVQESEGKLKESLTMNLAGLSAQRDEGMINQETYSAQKDYFTKQYLTQKAEAQSKSVKFQVDTIMQQYTEELGAAMPEFQKEAQELLNGAITSIQAGGPEEPIWTSYEQEMQKLGKKAGLDKSTIASLKELYKPLEESVSDLQQLSLQMGEEGAAIPEGMAETLSNAASLGAITGNIDAIHKIAGDAILESPEALEVINNSRAQGYYIPKGIADEIDGDAGRQAIKKSIEDLMEYTNHQIMTANLGLYLDSQKTEPNFALAKPYGKLPGHADGGIFDRPHVAWFAEDGPEAAVPLDGSDRALAIWKAAGEQLGVYEQNNYGRIYRDMTSGSSMTNNTINQQTSEKPVFSVTINVTGTASEDQARQTAQIAMDQLAPMIDRYFEMKYRVKF